MFLMIYVFIYYICDYVLHIYKFEFYSHVEN